jgi:protein-S-isoprenylcysteine O-methyltransferase Ste14
VDVDFVRVGGVAGEGSAMAWAEVYGTRQEEFRPSILLRLRELLLTHALPAAFFGFLCGVKALLAIQALQSLLHVGSVAEAGTVVLRLADQTLGLLYFGLIAFCCVTRLPKQRGRGGRGTIAAALFASFAILLIGILPDRRPRPELEVAGSLLLALGMAYSIWALSSLGRSFSILPEARRLVTDGPYALSRHPLYLGEAVAALGLLLPMAGPVALAFAFAALSAQLLRMRWEESVLTSEFPEYRAYARRVPRYLPFIA